MAQGRGTAWLEAALLVAAMHVATAEAVTWTIGGSNGWTLAYDYTTWASGKTFKTGDILFFPYTQAEHNVVEVPRSSYDSCSSTGALSIDSEGNTNVTLKTAGTHYFICSVIGHCSAGMKLAVKVVSAAGATAPAPAKSPTPSPPATSPGYSPPPLTPDYYYIPSYYYSTDSDNGKRKTGIIAGVTVAVFVMLILSLALITVLYLRRRRPPQTQGVLSSAAAAPSTPGQKAPHPLSARQYHSRDTSSILPLRCSLVQYSYVQLYDATNNFDTSRFLGKGGFGPVYKGEIDGEIVAVKCIDEGSRQGFKEFKAELNIISDLRHRNLVRLRGWCYEESKYFLVYEYAANKSLDTILFNDERCRDELNWERRFGIVMGLGSALQYLHEDCERVIIHRDIKTSNVLLDAKYNAKVGDFGLSRAIAETQTYTTMVAGTPGYIAPEVMNLKIPTKESDVYSFGVVLAEIACGRRILSGGFVLLNWLREHLSEERLLEAVDGRLGGEYNTEEMMRVLWVALACTHQDPEARPSIRVAMEMLRGTKALPAVPIYKPVHIYPSSLPGSATTTSTYSSHESFFGSTK